MDAHEQQRWRDTIRVLYEALVAAQAERPQRQEFTEAGEIGWVLFERDTMLAVTNRLRADRGLSPVTLERIERAEQRACGHSDYSKTFAIGCADIVFDRDPYRRH